MRISSSLLPDLAAGRKLAGFAITEPEAGSDAFHVQSRAVRESDGHWRLDGEKRWIGNGSKDIIVALAQTEKDRHNLLILEKGMDGFDDYSLEAAIVKVTGSEFVWYAANRVFQLAGGLAYMADQPYEKILRDTRVFPIFEGANDVLRVYISLSGLKGLGEELEDLKSLDLREPIRSLGILAEYAGGRIRREIRPDRLTRAHQDLEKLADPIADQVKRLRNVGEQLLRQHRDKITERQGQLKRLTNTVSDIYGQIAVLARVSDVIASEQPSDAPASAKATAGKGEERTIAERFVSRAASRVDRWLHQIEENDDDRMQAIAQRAYERGSYGHSL